MSTLDYFELTPSERRRMEIDDDLMLSPKHDLSFLTTRPQEDKDTALECAIQHNSADHVIDICHLGVSEQAYSMALRRSVVNFETAAEDYKRPALSMLNALVEGRERQKLPKEAGPIARMLERGGMHETAMAVSDIDLGLQLNGKMPGRKTAIAGVALSAAVAVLTKMSPSPAELHFAEIIALGSTALVAMQEFGDAFVAGRGARLKQAALDLA